ncbi:flippase [Arenibacter latericius]|uniref:flippase n=1 Tax=Arenibacter latericius TaxID=86104 RepID=UPI0003F5BCCB|nr:flippase [Arenibacter latericius]
MTKIIDKLDTLRKNAGFKKYLKNTSWLFGGNLVNIFASLFVGVWVARYLGPENLGILSYAQSFTALFLAFSTLGLTRILARDLVKDPNDKYVLLGTSFILQTIGSIILMALLLTTLFLTSDDKFLNKIIIILGSVTFVQSFSVIDVYFQSIVKSKSMVLVGVISLIISSLLKVILILLEAPLIHFVYVTAIDSITLAIGQIYFYKKNKESILKWSFSLSKAKQLLRDSWPLILSTIIVSIYMKIDQVMLKEMINNQAVGQYAAAARLSESWYFIPSIISSSLFPAIVNAKKINEDLYYDRIQNLYDLMVWLSVAIALPMTFLSNWIVNLLYGSEYYQAGTVLSIHIWAGVFVFLGVSRGGWIINENLQRFSSLYLGIGMIANVVLNYILIPINGVIGAAIATLASQSISVLFAPFFFKQTRICTYMMLKSLFFVSLFKKIKS